MTTQQTRLLAFPMVMIAGSLYALTENQFAGLIGGVVFFVGIILFVSEWARSLKS